MRERWPMHIFRHPLAFVLLIIPLSCSRPSPAPLQPVIPETTSTGPTAALVEPTVENPASPAVSLPETTQPAAAQLNLLAMGDWGEGAPAQKKVADAMADYVTGLKVKFSGLLSAGDNFYVPLSGVDDPVWQNLFEKMYDPKRLDFPFYIALGNHDSTTRINTGSELALCPASSPVAMEAAGPVVQG